MRGNVWCVALATPPVLHLQWLPKSARGEGFRGKAVNRYVQSEIDPSPVD